MFIYMHVGLIFVPTLFKQVGLCDILNVMIMCSKAGSVISCTSHHRLSDGV